MKKFLIASALSVASVANAAPSIIISFASDELEQFYKEKRYSDVIVGAVEKLYGSSADDVTIAIFGDYGVTDNGSRCVYSINAMIGKQYNGFLIIDKSNANISRVMGTQVVSGTNCSDGVSSAFDFIAKSTVESVGKVIAPKKQIPPTNPKSHRTL